MSRRARIAEGLVFLVLVTFVGACGGAARHGGGSGPAGGDVASSQRESWAGTDPAPEFPGGLTWFNVAQPLTIADLKGKAVLLDFWTLGCINCQDIIPDLKKLESEFGDALVVIGVHSGKYSTEHDDQSIGDAIAKYGLEHPVVNDPNFAVWSAYGANAWPTLVLIDPTGKIVGGHAGEGVYQLFQPIIGAMLGEFDAKGLVDRTPLKLDLASTTTSTVLSYPAKVLADANGGRLFIADTGHYRILVADLSGRLEEAIGSGKAGFEDGGAAEAAFEQPQGLALSDDGTTLYVADTRNHAIRAVDVATGAVTTIAGTGLQADRLPVPGAKGKDTALAAPWDVLAVGNTLYIAMAGVHQIWTLDLETNGVAVFAGTSREGIDNGARTKAATLAQPSGLASDGRFLYWVDAESSSVRKVALSLDTEGQVETLVGTGLFDFGDKDGNGTKAQLQHAQGITYADGILYVADTYNHKVRAVDAATRNVTTVSGDGQRGWEDGPPSAARYDEPGGLSAAGGRLYVADTNNHLIRVVDIASGQATTLQLSNLDVASAQVAAATVTLSAQSVSTGAGTIDLTLAAPDGYHLNALAPSHVEFRAGGAVESVAMPSHDVRDDGSTTTVSTPAMFQSGTGPFLADVTAYYCRTGAEALCLVQRVEISVTVTSSEGGGHQLVLSYLLPEAPGEPKSP